MKELCQVVWSIKGGKQHSLLTYASGLLVNARVLQGFWADENLKWVTIGTLSTVQTLSVEVRTLYKIVSLRKFRSQMNGEY